MNHKTVTLDMREEFRSGERPCDKIHNALDNVAKGEALRLLVPFEPAPLFESARSRGLTHHARQIVGGDWEVLFTYGESADQNHQSAEPGKHSCGCGCLETEPAEVVDVDARHLEPPQPMVKILEALGDLPQGASLRAHTDRRPVHLYPMLESRGFTGESQEQPDGSFITDIRRA